MPGRTFFKPAQQIGVVAERQPRVQAVDDVHFGDGLAGALPELVEDLLDRHRVRAGHALLQPRERAEQARRFADVGRFEPQVVIEVGPRAVAPLALAVRDPAERQQIGRVEQRDAVVERQPFPRVDLLGDRRQPGGDLQTVDSAANQSHDLRANGPRARAIHLAAQHALPPPDHQLAAADLHRHRLPEQHRAQVRVGVLPIAVGMLGIVVLVVLLARDDVFEERQDVGLERLSAIR